MSKVYIRTNANNAEKTIRRAIESVLSQTYGNFLYFIDDNGSTDGTRKIIEEYATKDERIVPFFNKINNVFEDEYIKKNFCELTESIADDDFFCYLDADDEYDSTFLYDMLNFMYDNSLDIACCGSRMLSVEHNNSLTGVRCLKNNLILQNNDDFEKFFPVYHQFARTVWGKVYKGFTLRGRTFYDNPEDFTYPSYGSDTINTLKAFSKANRVGILARTLHNYYISKKSVSYKLDPKRVVSDQLLHEFSIEYLSKFGSVSKQNMDFLYNVYFNAIKDTIMVILHSKENCQVKLNALSEIFSCPITKETFSCKYVDANNKKAMLAAVANWAFSYKDNAENKVKITSFIFDYYFSDIKFKLSDGFYHILILKASNLLKPIIAENYEAALKMINTSYKSQKKKSPELNVLEIILLLKLTKPDIEILKLCECFIEQFSNSEYIPNVKQKILQIVNKLPILKNLNIDFCISFKNVINAIIVNDYKVALKSAISIEKKHIDKYYMEKFYLLCQNIACYLNDQDKFLYFKKLSIRYYIENKLLDKARNELSDFDVLLPNDEEFQAFRKYLST